MDSSVILFLLPFNNVFEYLSLSLFLKETSEVFELETTKPLAKTFCQLCHNKDKRIKALEEQNEKHEIVIKRNMLGMYNTHNKELNYLI